MDCNLITEQEFFSVCGDIEPLSNYYKCNGVVFSAVKKGEALRVHVGCSRENMKHLRSSCQSFIKNMFSQYDWCKMLIATVDVKNKSVYNLCLKLGFIDHGIYKFEGGDANIMVIER